MEANRQDNINDKDTNTMQIKIDGKFEKSMNKRKYENKLQYPNINEEEDGLSLFKQIKGNIQEEIEEPDETGIKKQSENESRRSKNNNKDYIHSIICRFCGCVNENIENIEHKAGIESNTEDSEKNHPPADLKTTNSDHNVDRDFFTILNQNVQNENDVNSDQKTTKATDPSITITGDIEQLKQIVDFLMENNRVVAMGEHLFAKKQKCARDIYDGKFENSIYKRKFENKLQYPNINEEEDGLSLFKQIKGNIQEEIEEPDETGIKKQSENESRRSKNNNKDYIHSIICRFCGCVNENIENIEHKAGIESNTEDSEKNHPPADLKTTNSDHNVDRDFFTKINQNVQNENDVDSDTDLTHEQLDQKTTKATNWSICITGDIEQLKQIVDFLMENNKVVAMRGQIEQSKSIEQKTYLQIMLKYKNQVPNSAIHNLIKKCCGAENLTRSIKPVTETKFIELMLANVTKKEKRMIGQKPIEKGRFTYPRCKKYNHEDQAVQLIRKLGPRKAEEEWAEKQLPYVAFKKAKNQYQFEKRNQRNKELQSQAENLKNHMYPWQAYVYCLIKQEPDARSIYVVLDKEGGRGKTSFQNMLKDLYPDDVVDLKNGTTKDITYLAAQQELFRIVQFNLTRQNTSTLNMEAIEMIKDGNFSSMKYIPTTVRRKPPHLFIYTNKELDWNGMTEDRWHIIHLSKHYENGYKTFTLFHWKADNIL